MWKNMVQSDTPQVPTHGAKKKKRFSCKNTHTHTQNIQHVLLFHGNNGYANVSRRYVICTLPVLKNAVVTYVFVWRESAIMKSSLHKSCRRKPATAGMRRKRCQILHQDTS